MSSNNTMLQASVQPSLAVSVAHLMHTAAAYHTPALVAFDHIVALHSRRALRIAPCASTSTTLLDLPAEILLEVRAHLLPSAAAGIQARALAALARFERMMPVRLCGECIEYNQDVFGKCGWDWPNFCTGCDCPRDTERRRGLSRACKSPREWVEAHLSKQLRRPIWSAVDDMLADAGCKVDRLPLCSEGKEKTTVSIVAIKQDAANAAQVLERAQNEFNLYEQGELPGMSHPSHAVLDLVLTASCLPSSVSSQAGIAVLHPNTGQDDDVRLALCTAGEYGTGPLGRLPDRVPPRGRAPLCRLRARRPAMLACIAPAPRPARTRRGTARARALRLVRRRRRAPSRVRACGLSPWTGPSHVPQLAAQDARVP